MGVDVLDEPVRIFAHLKEIGLFLCRLHLPAAVRTFAIHKLGLCEEGLAGSAVHPLVISLVNISLVVQLFENLLHLLLVIRIRGADELVVGGVHQIPDSLNLPCHIVHKLLWRHAGFLGLQLDLLPVLVGSGLEEHVIPLAPLVPGNGICQHDLVGVPDVGLA